uniref:Uncharacterized protein n=1 Tax=Myoviridae sp. ctLnO19 TaxID=2825085 RepID=A0A8S5P026_9CAUD|nr:MAG TPA: hypothetical protein [Myoviridae sp. ctLnO19]
MSVARIASYTNYPLYKKGRGNEYSLSLRSKANVVSYTSQSLKPMGLPVPLH